jgi:hypothetical protein
MARRSSVRQEPSNWPMTLMVLTLREQEMF